MTHAEFTQELLAEIQKKYPTANIRRGELAIPYRDNIAVELDVRANPYRSAGEVDWSNGYISFDYYGKRGSRDNELRLKGFTTVVQVAVAALKKIYPLYKKAVVKIDHYYARVERQDRESKELYTWVKQIIGQGFEVVPPEEWFDSVVVKRGEHTFDIDTIGEKVAVNVPLDKLGVVLDILDQGKVEVQS